MQNTVKFEALCLTANANAKNLGPTSDAQDREAVVLEPVPVTVAVVEDAQELTRRRATRAL